MKHLKRAAAAFMVAATALFVTGTTVFASAPPPVEMDTTDVATVVVAAPVVTLIVSAVIPLLVGLLSKATWSPVVKAVMMIVLNGISAFVTSSMLADGTAAFSDEMFWTWLVGVIVSAVAYVVGYKPNGVTSNTGGKLAQVGVK